MYLDHYGLKDFPFQLTPDHRFFFDSRPHRKAMAYLTYGLSKGEGFIVVTGEVGAGKTTLMNYLLTTLNGQNIVTAKIVNTQVQADDLLRLAAAAFGIDRGDMNKGLLLKALEATLARHAGAGRRGLLIVDEAQGLGYASLEELRMLSNLQVGSRSILQICLLGQPEFRKTIVRPELDQLRQRVIASYHLGSLDAEDTQGYIQHRLLQAGWRGHPHFNAEAAAAIHEHTGGIPRKINFLCDRLLLYGYLEDKDRLGANDVETIVREMGEEAVGIRSASKTVAEKADAAPLNGRPISKREFIALMERLESLEALLSSRVHPPAENETAVPAEKRPSAEEVDGAVQRVASLEKRLRQGTPPGS